MSTEGPSPLLAEGEEPAPRGVVVMGWLRWALLASSAFLAAFMWWSHANEDRRNGSHLTEATAKYHCPMHPQIVSNEPGECPICHMNLEPITSHRAEAAPAPNGSASSAMGNASRTAGATGPVAPGAVPPGTTPITLTLDRVQSIGVRTAVVTEGASTDTLRATAVVAPTEQGVAEVHVRAAGFIERLLVDQTGVAVARQQPLFAIYSPEIFQAENELLTARQWEAADAGTSTAAAARRKLELLGMSSHDIDEVLKTREPMRAIPIYAPRTGFVTKKNLVAGSYVTPEMPLYEIQDLSRVYVVADVFQQDIGFLHKGTAGRFSPAHRPDQAVQARIDLLYPTLNAEARTTRVRMVIQNPNGTAFRPGEYGSVEFATPARKALTVPRDAVVDTGLYTYVFVVEGDGTFSPREVIVGGEQGETTTVLAGVSPGDRVVSGATFLIDSESRLQASAAQTIPKP